MQIEPLEARQLLTIAADLDLTEFTADGQGPGRPL